VEVKNFKYKVLSYLQTHGYEHELDATESLGQYDDGALKIIDYAIDFQYPITVPSLGSIIDGSTGKTVQETCEEWTHIFIGDDPVEVKADQLLTCTSTRIFCAVGISRHHAENDDLLLFVSS
jgi:hypothetical protein